MATINISLPDSLKEFVEARVAQNGYSTVSEFFRDLIRDYEKRQARAELDARLLEGIESGAASEMTKDEWNELRRIASKGMKL